MGFTDFDRVFIFVSSALILIKVGGLKTNDLVWFGLAAIWLAYPLWIVGKGIFSGAGKK